MLVAGGTFSALGPKPLKILEEDGKPANPQPVGSVHDMTIPGPGGDLTIRAYQPFGAAADGDRPVQGALPVTSVTFCVARANSSPEISKA